MTHSDSSREIRVFLSSTFRDMEAERSHLIKTIFPRVRAACRLRQVGFTEIDLRWGVTEEESKNGATVEICLKEIDRCRDFPPFFIGFLGERYGWIPRHDELASYWEKHGDSPYAVAIQDAVRRGISVTELEMELAVFGNEVTPAAFTPGASGDDRALFLLRDPSLSLAFYQRACANTPETRECDFIDAGGGKLENLKQKIRQSGLLKVDNYTSVEMFGQRIEHHLLGALNRYFPAAEVPSEDERVEAAHRGFRHHRLSGFYPRSDVKNTVIKGIQARIDLPSLGPLLVIGPSGQGKSAFIADLARSIETGKIHLSRRLYVIDHYLGADDADTLELWMKRVLRRLKSLIDDDSLDIPDTVEAQKKALITWAGQAARSPRCGGSPDQPVTFVLLVDGLDHLRNDPEALFLLMPESVGADCVVVASTSEEALACRVLEKKEKILLPPLSPTVVESIVHETLGRFRKKLDPREVRRLVQSPQCGIPLFLTLALEELRVDANHETLSGVVDHILQSQDAPSLFLNNYLLDPDYSRAQQPDLAACFMAYLAASHAGLTELHLAGLLALPEDPVAEDIGKPRLPQAALSHLIHNFDGFLLEMGDRRAPMHRMFGEVALNYCGEARIRLQLLRAFATKTDDADNSDKAEVLHQLTWLSAHAPDERVSWRSQLLECLAIEIDLWQTHEDVFENALALLDESEKEILTQRWVDRCEALPEHDLEALAKKWQFHAICLASISFHGDLAAIRVAEALLHRLQASQLDSLVMIDVMESLGAFYQSVDRHQDAFALESAVLEARRLIGLDHPDTLSAMSNLATTLGGLGDHAGAKVLQEIVLNACRRLYGEEHPETYDAMSALALSLVELDDLTGARTMQEIVLEKCRRMFGEEHPVTFAIMNDLANTLDQQGDQNEARTLRETVLCGYKRLRGGAHPETLMAMNNFAISLSDGGDTESAVKLMQSVLDTSHRLYGEEHPDTLLAMLALAEIFMNGGEYERALDVWDACVDLSTRIKGVDHEDTLEAMINLAVCYSSLEDHEKALQIEEMIYEKISHNHGPDHPETLTAYSNIASTIGSLGDLDRARRMQEEILEESLRLFGSEHPVTLNVINNLAFTLSEQGQWQDALKMFENLVEIYKCNAGPEDDSTLDAMNNLFWIEVQHAEYLAESGQYQDALPLLSAAAEKMIKLHGEESEESSSVYSSLGWLHHQMGNDTKARKLLEKALNIEIAINGKNTDNAKLIKKRITKLRNKK